MEEKKKVAEDIGWEKLDRTKFFGFSAILFMAVRSVVYPATLVKTRLQIQNKPNPIGGATSAPPIYNSTLNAFKIIWSQEGLRGIYRGYATMCVGILPGQFLYIASYEVGRTAFDQLLSVENKAKRQFLRNAFGGGVATLCSSILSVPLDVVTQRLMVERGKHVKGRDVIKHIIQTEGIAGLYRGYGAFIIAYVPSSAIWWSTYQTIRRFLSKRFNDLGMRPSYGLDLSIQGFSGGCAGVIAAVSTNPLDVAKTRIQVLTEKGTEHLSRNPIVVLRDLIKAEGLSAIMKGATARVLNMAPNSFLIIIAYELVKKWSKIEG